MIEIEEHWDYDLPYNETAKMFVVTDLTESFDDRCCIW